jgi:NAD(P)H-dependent FMN reductase
MERRINIALIYGSTREGRLCDKVVQWALAFISRSEKFQLDVIDPRDYGFSTVSEAIPKKDLSNLSQRIDQADAFIIVTPEYNHGYPAPLKALIDSAYAEWNAKPVAFISYGGSSGGIRAVEQLRQVFAELHGVTMRDGVAFTNVWDQFSSNGDLRSPERAEKSLTTLIAQLEWWARALKNARHTNSYQEIAK